MRELDAVAIANDGKGFFSSERTTKSTDSRLVNAAKTTRAADVRPTDVVVRTT